MLSIEQIPEDERKHFIECPKCHGWIDMRNLSDVTYHEAGDCLLSHQVDTPEINLN